MDLPIDQEELDIIIETLNVSNQHFGLYNKLKLTRDLMVEGLPYKKILREQHGMVA